MLGTLAFTTVLGAAEEGDLSERQRRGEELQLEGRNGIEARDGGAWPGEAWVHRQCLPGLRGGQGESRGAKTSEG